MSTGFTETHVIKLGGSLIVPNGGIHSAYLQRFAVFIGISLVLKRHLLDCWEAEYLL